MFSTNKFRLTLLFCTVCVCRVASQLPQTYYHYPVPSNPVDFSVPSSQYTHHNVPQQQQHYKQQQQQHYKPQQQQQSSSSYNFLQQPSIRTYYANLRPSATTAHAQLNKQFAAPALENAAFVGALAHQGYDVRHVGSLAAASSPASASVASLPSSSAVGTETHSLNVKLPLPLGVSPISVAPLPLQPGSPYDKKRDYVTSYGTREFQRYKK